MSSPKMIFSKGRSVYKHSDGFLYRITRSIKKDDSPKIYYQCRNPVCKVRLIRSGDVFSYGKSGNEHKGHDQGDDALVTKKLEGINRLKEVAATSQETCVKIYYDAKDQLVGEMIAEGFTKEQALATIPTFNAIKSSMNNTRRAQFQETVKTPKTKLKKRAATCNRDLEKSDSYEESLDFNTSNENLLDDHDSSESPSLVGDRSNLFQQGVCQYAYEEPNLPQGALDYKNSSNEIDCDAYGEYVSKQLQDICKTQRLIAEKLINDVLFIAKLGKLSPLHSVACPSDNEINDTPIVTTCTDIKEEIGEVVAPVTEANLEHASLLSVPIKEHNVVKKGKGKRIPTKETRTEQPQKKRHKASVSNEKNNPNSSMNYLPQPMPLQYLQFTTVKVERMDDDEITIKEEPIEEADDYDNSGNDRHDKGIQRQTH